MKGMSIRWLALLAWLAGWAASAQVRVEVVMPRDVFLEDEPVLAGIRVINHSGRPITLGKDNRWLQIALQTRGDQAVEARDELPAVGEFTVGSGEMGTRKVNLTPYFNIRSPGRYQATALVRIEEWDMAVASAPAEFSVIMGTKLWEQTFGLPAEGTAAAGRPEFRKYALVKATTLKAMFLYLRVTDAEETRIYSVQPVGPLVSSSRPEAQVGPGGHLHLLNQVGARRFQYCEYDSSGELQARRSYQHTDTRPSLRATKDGRIVVAGGIRMLKADDYPGPERGRLDTPVAAPVPAPAMDLEVPPRKR
ncbi:MAG TPA: hypothetical protein P5555_07850 [Candidatus Paceibacterota bacterium]|nr:hypothetical protein [Verrucomicrobiota bacterium]HRZ45088.1 hypothetical protein [Candidatus Paceibacterota bacterium]HRZ93495.1 hypothetical protein [Candidatus Paceibacterota bacterium]